MNANSFSPTIRDYFEVPVCSDETADLAYREFLGQGSEAGADFSQILEAQAWLAPFRGSDLELGL